MLKTEDINKENSKPRSQPKLGVYTSIDGSVYSKPEEVKAVLEWIKSMSEYNKKQGNKNA